MIYFVGPLPPPVHGFSVINKKMLSLLRMRCSVCAFDLAPGEGGIWGGVLFLMRVLKLFCLFVFGCFAAKPRSLYVGLSGGYRQVLDSLFILVARGCGVKIFIHHHSFAYLNNRNLVAKVCMFFIGGAEHIVLCENMKLKLAEQYGVEKSKIHVLSNSAFLDLHPSSLRVFEKCDSGLRVGFFSNITFAKGIFDFFDLMDVACAKGLVVDGLIAGPLDKKIKSEFQRRLARLPRVRYIGPVYDEVKINFFSQLDVMVFPTRYVNEAEPIAILEALSFGVPVIAVERGCIECMLPPEAGVSVANNEEFVGVAIEEIINCLNDSSYLLERHKNALLHFKGQQTEHEQRLNVLLAQMCDIKV